MNKHSLLFLCIATFSFLSIHAQQYGIVPASPLLIKGELGLQASCTSPAVDTDGNLYLCLTDNSTGRATVLRQSALTGLVDTFPGGSSLPLMANGIAVYGGKLYVSGVNGGASPDSLLWSSPLATPNMAFVGGSPHAVQLPYFPTIMDMSFLNGKVFLSGFFKYANGTDSMPNLAEYDPATGAFSQNVVYRNYYRYSGLTGRVRISNLGKEGSVTFYSPESQGYEQTVFSASGDSGLAFQALSLPGEYKKIASACYYRNDLYVTAIDSNYAKLSIFRQRASSALETLATLTGNGASMVPMDTFDGKLIMVMGTPRFDSVSGQTLSPVVAYDSLGFSPVITAVDDSINHLAYVSEFSNGYLHGYFTSLNGTPAVNLARLTFGSPSAITPVTVSTGRIYSAGRTVIAEAEGEHDLTVCTLAGVVAFKRHFSDRVKLECPVAEGIYIVTFTTASGPISKKVLLEE